MLAAIPNLLAADVPDGPDESANVELRKWGKPGNFKKAGFEPKQHFELGEALGLMDFEAAAKISGARFTVLKGGLARLERALGQFMLDVQTGDHGYTEVSPPLLVGSNAMYGTAQLPKFKEDLFSTPIPLQKPKPEKVIAPIQMFVSANTASTSTDVSWLEGRAIDGKIRIENW